MSKFYMIKNELFPLTKNCTDYLQPTLKFILDYKNNNDEVWLNVNSILLENNIFPNNKSISKVGSTLNHLKQVGIISFDESIINVNSMIKCRMDKPSGKYFVVTDEELSKIYELNLSNPLFSVYLLLKMSSKERKINGMVKYGTSITISEICKSTGVADSRTVKKYLDELIEYNLIARYSTTKENKTINFYEII